MYIRFVVGNEKESIQKQTGLFWELDELNHEGKLEDYQVQMVKQIFKYFNDNLPVPPYSRRNWSTNTFAWFKDSAEEYIGRMWDLVAILEQNDIDVRILKSNKPGMIIYEDEFQVVAQNGKSIVERQ